MRRRLVSYRWFAPLCVVLGASVIGVLVGRSASGASGPVGATHVSMRVRDVPVKEAYAQLARQSNFKIHFDWREPSDDARVSLSVIQQPFWKALTIINQKANRRVTWIRRDPNLEVWTIPINNTNSHPPLATAVDGLFYGVLDETDGFDAKPRGKKEPVNPAEARQSVLVVSICAEPTVRPLLLHTIKVEQLVDEFGRPLTSTPGAKTSLFNEGVGTTVLTLPPRAWPRRVGRLRMSAKLLAGVKSETAEVDHLMMETPPVVTTAGFRIETKTGKGKLGHQITLNMTRLGTTGPDWLRPSNRLGLLEPVVVDNKGRRFNVLVYDRDWFGKTCRFSMETSMPHPYNKPPNLMGDPHKLFLDIPTEVVEYDVRLEFSDVTLR